MDQNEKTFFSSDTHLGHLTPFKLSKRPYNDIYAMNKALTDNTWSVPGGSNVYFTGDLAWTMRDAIDFFEAKPRNIHFHWILGNHDHRLKIKELSKYCASIQEQKVIHKLGFTFTLSHYPLGCWHRSTVNTAFNLYGHIHVNTPQWKPVGKQLNMNCEFHNYKPVSVRDTIELMRDMPDNWEYTELKRRGER